MPVKEGEGNKKEQNEDKEVEINTQLIDITDNLIESAPDCDINEEIGEDAPVDNKGRFFDINLHKLDENGLPILNKNGSLAIKRGKNKKKEEQIKTEDNTNFNNENAGKLFAQYTFAFCSGIFGKEFLPVQNEEINETDLLASAYTEFLKSKNIEEVSPGLILAGSISLYILPRLMQEKVQENILTKAKRLYRKFF